MGRKKNEEKSECCDEEVKPGVVEASESQAQVVEEKEEPKPVLRKLAKFQGAK